MVKTVQISFNTTPDVVAQLDALAADQDRSRSKMVALLVASALAALKT